MRAIFLAVLFALPLLTGYAWAQGNATADLVSMFNPANAHSNSYVDPQGSFSIEPPQGWIQAPSGNRSDTALVTFTNENPESQADFSIYYHQGKPIPGALYNTPDSQILDAAVSDMFDTKKYSIYQKNIQRFSDGLVIQAVAAEKQASNQTNIPIIEEFSFWLADGREYFLVMISSQNGFYQNAADFEHSAYTFYAGPAAANPQIPLWVKNNARWWSEGTIDDANFLKGIEYLVQKGIIVVPPANATVQQAQSIPSWIKNSAGWWADGKISDGEFEKGIQYLISSGIIRA